MHVDDHLPELDTQYDRAQRLNQLYSAHGWYVMVSRPPASIEGSNLYTSFLARQSGGRMISIEQTTDETEWDVSVFDGEERDFPPHFDNWEDAVRYVREHRPGADIDLNPDQRVLYNIITDHGEIDPATLYEAYRQRAPDPKTERMVRYHLQTLHDACLIEIAGENRGRTYRSAD